MLIIIYDHDEQVLFFYFSGGVFGSLMPREEYFARALYTIDIGQNDLGSAISVNKTIQEIDASIPDTVNVLATNVKVVYLICVSHYYCLYIG